MDIFIGADRSEKFHFESGGTRLECPFCSWYLEHTGPAGEVLRMMDRMEWADVTTTIPDWQAAYRRIAQRCADHLRETHPDELAERLGPGAAPHTTDEETDHG